MNSSEETIQQIGVHLQIANELFLKLTQPKPKKKKALSEADKAKLRIQMNKRYTK